jgi:hypothetical protein
MTTFPRAWWLSTWGDRSRSASERVRLVYDDADVAGSEEGGEGAQVLAVHHASHELHAGRSTHQPRPRHPWEAGEHAARVPTLFGMKVPDGARTRAVAEGGWFITLSRITS